MVSGTQSKWCTGLTVLRAIYILVAVYMLLKDLSDRKSTPRHICTDLKEVRTPQEVCALTGMARLLVHNFDRRQEASDLYDV